MPDAGCRMPDAGCVMHQTSSISRSKIFSRVQKQSGAIFFIRPELKRKKSLCSVFALRICENCDLLSIQYPASSIQHPVPRIQHPVPSIKYPASSIKHPETTEEKMNTEIRKPRTPILFVDDEPTAHLIVKSHLKDWHIISAYSAEEALEILNRQHILIVITDIGMPGMDGLEFLREVRKTRGIIQVVIVTASNQIDDLVSAFEAGATDFLLKPFKKHEIESALENILVKIERWKATMKELFQRRKGMSPEQMIPLDEDEE
jgi:CheY-like chemotaxis protein